MKKILFLLLLISGMAYGQTPPGYTKISSRYAWLATMGDSGTHVTTYPSTPYRRAGVSTRAGNVGIDTVLHSFQFYSGGSWRRTILNTELDDTAAAIRADFPSPGSGGANAKLSSPVLKGSGDSISLAVQYRTNTQGNEQSGYITNLAWTNQTLDAGYQWKDGASLFYINDTTFAIGGYNNVTITDSIYYSTDLGKTWSPYATKWPYALGNVASIKARYPGQYNYLVGHTSDNTHKKKVYRFKNLQNLELMTSTAEWGNILLYGLDQDDNGNLYLVGGQTSNADTTTTLKDVWYSTAQSGGANWSQVQSDVSKIGGCLIDQVVFRDGYLYVINAMNKMSSGVSAYSPVNMRIPVHEIRDSTKWQYIENSPSEVGSKLFVSTQVYNGMIFVTGGADSGPSNTNGVAYLDKNDKWHTYYSFYGMDPASATPASHASDLIVAKNSLLRFMGNGNTSVDRLSDTTFSTPGRFRKYLRVQENTWLSNILSENAGMLGSGVTASEVTNSNIVRVAAENYTPYYQLLFGGHRWGGLTNSQTINTGYINTTGTQMVLDPTGQLTIGLASSSAGTRLYNYGNAYFDGNNTNAPIQFSHNGSTATGVMTGVAGQAWYGSGSGSDTRFFANNGSPNMVLTGTGLRIGDNNTATHPLHVVGLSKFETGNQSAGKLLMGDANGVSDWANTFIGQQYTFGTAGSGSSPTVTVLRGFEAYGNAVAPALGWGETVGGGVVGKLTNSGSDAWVGSNGKLKLFASNGTPNATLTTTGLRIGDNSDPAAVLHVVGVPRIVTGNEGAGKMLVSDADGDADWQELITENTYTPTLFNTTNIAASTASVTNYQRIGDRVYVYGEATFDATAALTITEVGMSLPIATSLGNTYDLAGTASFEDNTSVQIVGDVGNNRAKFRFTPQTATNNKYSFHFSYKYVTP